jgi:hypothetical protein
MERAQRTENTIAYLSYDYFVVAFAACFCIFHMGWWVSLGVAIISLPVSSLATLFTTGYVVGWVGKGS